MAVYRTNSEIESNNMEYIFQPDYLYINQKFRIPFFCGKFKNLVLPLLLAHVPCKRAYSTIKLYLRMAGITSLCDVMTKSLAFMCQVQWKTTVNRSRCRMAS